MFGIISFAFAWRKEASRCKKMIKRVQCRLKLLKNKRCSIVRQLRDDVAQLLKHGHEQSAFDRVEQIFTDESIVGVYDLLDQYCEFIIIHLSYIRKHKDCPNDIGEAVSSLIFASARCGDLPELREIRKLFGERYGENFALVSRDLRPGNLVNKQIQENLSIKQVSVHVKFKLVNEIARGCLRTGPLALEYYPDLQDNQTSIKSGDQVLKNDFQSDNLQKHEPQMQSFDFIEENGKIEYMDLPKENRKLWAEPLPTSYQGSNTSTTSTCSLMVLNSSPSSFGSSVSSNKEPIVASNTLLNSPYKVEFAKHEVENMDVDYSSGTSSQWPNEYDIEEYKSSMSTHVNFQDQRLFMFKPSISNSIYKLEDDLEEGYTEKSSSLNEKSRSRRSRKNKKALGKRQRRRSHSRDSTSVTNIEAMVYYGEMEENSRKFHRHKKHQRKVPVCDMVKSSGSGLDAYSNTKIGAKIGRNDTKNKNGGKVHECSLIQPCYFCMSDDESQGKKTIIANKLEKEEALSIFCTKKETNEPCLRTMTMPPERLKDSLDENVVRSNSLPAQQQKNGSPACRHVHPNLPDYDELAATFTALKKANSRIKSHC